MKRPIKRPRFRPAARIKQMVSVREVAGWLEAGWSGPIRHRVRGRLEYRARKVLKELIGKQLERAAPAKYHQQGGCFDARSVGQDASRQSVEGSSL